MNDFQYKERNNSSAILPDRGYSRNEEGSHVIAGLTHLCDISTQCYVMTQTNITLPRYILYDFDIAILAITDTCTR